jgi:hypothetical protein
MEIDHLKHQGEDGIITEGWVLGRCFKKESWMNSIMIMSSVLPLFRIRVLL